MGSKGNRGSTRGPAAARLKKLRSQAGLTIRQMSEELGYEYHTKYQYWEDRYKKDHLPWEIFLPIKEILMARGVPESEIDVLLPMDVRDRLTRMDDKLTRILEMLAQEETGPAPSPERPRPRKPTH